MRFVKGAAGRLRRPDSGLKFLGLNTTGRPMKLEFCLIVFLAVFDTK